MEVLLLAVMGLSNIACFIVGARMGGKSIELPNLNPVEIVQESRAKREAKQEARREQDRIEIIMRNIEGYDGTGRGQKDVPKG